MAEHPSIQWNQIRMQSIDVVSAALQNSFHNALIFCEDAGPDMVVNMMRNKELSMELRCKCVEFICLLLKILYCQEKSDQGKSTQQLVDRLNTYLGVKLTEELRGILNHKEQLKTLNLIAFENFVKRIDTRLN